VQGAAIIVEVCNAASAAIRLDVSQCTVEFSLVHLDIFGFVITKLQVHLMLLSESFLAGAEDSRDYDYH